MFYLSSYCAAAWLGNTQFVKNSEKNTVRSSAKRVCMVTGTSRAQLIEIYVRHMVWKAAAIIGCPAQPLHRSIKAEVLKVPLQSV